MEERQISLKVENLSKHFPITKGVIIERQIGAVRAVDGISFEIKQGETFGLVGESGCGKTTAGRTIIQLYKPTSGSIYFEGQDITKLKGEALRQTRRKMQMIFQDPYASLNPRMTVRQIIGEPLRSYGEVRGKEYEQRILELMSLVSLNPSMLNRYPHEFSGGQRQRIGTARALALNPSLVICDEPISALDVSIQAQVVNLLKDLQEKLGHTYLFISHDLSMVRYICDRVAVMYMGMMAEMAEADKLYEHPMHPYTRALLSAVLVADPTVEKSRKRFILEGDVPSPSVEYKGCKFAGRCRIAQPICNDVRPEFREIRPGHQVACHFAE